MTTQIQLLPTPPQPSDTPSDFNSKAFSLLGALPNFVMQANALGGEMTVLGAGADADAQAAAASAAAAGQSANAAAGSANAAGNSAGQAAGSAGAANQHKLDAQEAAQRAETAASGMAQAIAMAQTFTVVPTTFQSMLVFVTQPHFRSFVWNGTKYVRAPWDRPGVLFFSHAPAANVTHGIQVRADVTYNTADHPDLAEILGVSGPTFILPEGRARVLRAADNGRGIDAALVNGYLQEDAGRNLTGRYYMSEISGGGAWGSTGNASGAFTSLSNAPGRSGFQTNGVAVGANYGLSLDASLQWPTANEFRVKSLTATLYITR